jgi:5-methyltetrahydrofolate--homocysteine methyltransferase
MDAITDVIYACVVAGDRDGVEAAVAQALREGLSPETILSQGLIAAMDEVGRRFETCEYFVPEMLVAARAMKAGLERLRPFLAEAPASSRLRVVLGTVQGDMHDIGKTLVGMMLEGAGMEVHDLGTDVPPSRFADAVGELGPSLIGLSALLTTTMTHMGPTIEAIRAADPDHRVKVIVGGAPLTDVFARAVGADGFAPDASRAVALARRLSSEALEGPGRPATGMSPI